MSSTPPLKVGVILPSQATQLLDVGPIDLLGMLAPEWLRSIGLPEEMIAHTPRFEFHFVNETGESPNQMTGGFRLAVTDSIKTCPPLDILLIGGPEPSWIPSSNMQTFLRTQHEHVSAFMSVCTGYLGPLHAGLLRNTRATAPRGLLHSLKGFPDVQWEERRWVRDGKMWSSGAVMNGFEMMGEFMRERWGGEEGGLVDVVLKAADVMKRGREY